MDTDGETVSASLEKLNLAIGDRDYTDGYYLVDGETVTTSLDSLNVALYNLAQTTASGTGQKYVETLASAITADTNHDLPYSQTYTPFASDQQPGKNMDIYVDGQLLVADYNTLGNNDYAEIDTDTWRPHFRVRSGANITYVIYA